MTTCPYCNALIAAADNAAADNAAAERPVCPRCGEPLPGRHGPQISRADTIARSLSTAAAPTPSANRKLVVMLVVGMLLMAGLGLAFALWTRPNREQRHPRRPTGTVVTTETPAELPALGYLPRDCNVLVGIRPADLLNDATAKKLLESMSPGPLEHGLKLVETWTGVAVDNLDHVVFAAALDRRFPPALFVSVQTRRPYAPESLARIVGAEPKPLYGRPLFQFTMKPFGQGYLWCPAERNLLLLLRADAVRAEDLDQIPKSRWQGTEQLSPALRDALEKRVDKQSLLWAAGRLEHADVLTMLLALAGTNEEDRALAGAIRTFAAGLVLDDGLRLSAAFEARDAPTARGLFERLRQSFPAARVLEPAAAEPTWVNFQLRAPADSVADALQSIEHYLPAVRKRQ